MTTQCTDQIICQEKRKSWDLAKIKLEYFDKTHVLSWNFSQRLPKLFLWPLRTFSRYVYAFSKYIFPSVTKSWPHGSAIRLYLSKSEKSWYFEKWNSKSGWNILTKPHVLSKVFFWRPLEKFLCVWRTCPRCLKDQSNLDLCVSAKMVFAWRTNQIILIEMWIETKQNAFLYFFNKKSEGGATITPPQLLPTPG